MLHLLRQFRKRLIEQSNAKRYLLYAFGEILLVVIGILIALQINNWNEERQLLAEEQYLLVELQKEFNANLENVRADYDINIQNYNATTEILTFFKLSINEVPIQQLDSLQMQLFLFGSFDPTNGVLDEIINTGKLGVIQNEKLRYQLSQWSSLMKNQQEDIQLRQEHYVHNVQNLVIKSFSFKNSDRYADFSHWTNRYNRPTLPPSSFESDLKMFFTREMEGALYIHLLNQDFVLLNSLDTEDFILELLDLIETELNN